MNPDDAIDRLVERGLLDEHDGRLRFTDEFTGTWYVYADTYADAPEAVFVETVAELFGLDPEEAERRIEAEGVTREQVVGYLAAQSHLGTDTGRGTLALFGQILAEVGPPPAVPSGIESLDDEAALAFVEEHDRAVVTVWRQDCEPCRALKADLEDALAGLPEGVAVAGVDGAAVPEFRARYGVEAAPSVLLFAGGEHADTVRGREPVGSYHAAFDRAFG